MMYVYWKGEAGTFLLIFAPLFDERICQIFDRKTEFTKKILGEKGEFFWSIFSLITRLSPLASCSICIDRIPYYFPSTAKDRGDAFTKGIPNNRIVKHDQSCSMFSRLWRNFHFPTSVYFLSLPIQPTKLEANARLRTVVPFVGRT